MSQTTTLGPTAETGPSRNRPPLIEVAGLNLWYGDQQALFDVAFDLFPSEIMAFIGPSGCGKTTALKCLNRMHDDVRGVRIEGLIRMNGEDIHRPEVDPPLHRRRFGWVAQKPNPFPMSVYDNIAYGATLHGLVNESGETDAIVESCLRQARLWDEVKDDLHGKTGPELSGGQQQRLCIARALSTQPEVLLMDEPTGSIDPIATAAIEELIVELKKRCAIVLITHSMMEARRIADRVAFFDLGRLVEIGTTEDVFTHPRSPRCADFIRGRIG